VTDNVTLRGFAHLGGSSWVFGDAIIEEYAIVIDSAWVGENAKLTGDAVAKGCSRVMGTHVLESETIDGDTRLV